MIISPKYDDFLKRMFRNEVIRKYFISDVLKIPLEDICSIELKNTFLWRRYWKQKMGILDIVLELNGRQKINIELQIKVVKSWDKRQLFYLSRLYTEDLISGGKYERLKKCVGISILDFNLTDRKTYHSVYRLRDEEGYEFSDILELHVIELKKELTGRGEVEDWIRFFNVENEEDLNMIKTKNPGILEAIQELRRMSMNNPIRLIYEAYQKKVRDEMAREDYVREEAMTKGMEEGRKKGMEEGRAKGMAEGKIEGKIEGEQLLAELVKRLLADKRFDDIKLVSEDERTRQRLYKEYGLEENG